jgi:hypothetical protein
MPDQEMLREIKRVLELTSRIDERVSTIAESHEKMGERFDRFLEQHAVLVERVTRLEGTTWTGAQIEARLKDIKDEQVRTVNRVTAVEAHSPYALKIVDQSLEALNKLTDRVRILEEEAKATGTTVKTWQGWVSWFGDWCFKVAWIVIAAYILARIGLGGVSIPAPF